MKIIRKTLHDLAKPPNLIDYERARANFDWSAAPRLCRGMGAGGCNIAFAAVDRHAHGHRRTHGVAVHCGLRRDRRTPYP